MNRLFIHLYLDEDVSVLIAELVRARGFEVTTALEAGMLGKTDQDQLEFAAASQMAEFTHNRIHFERLAEEWFAAGVPHSGIMIGVRRSPYEIGQRLLALLNQITADEMDNQILYL